MPFTSRPKPRIARMRGPSGVHRPYTRILARMTTGLEQYDNPPNPVAALQTLGADVAYARRSRGMTMEQAAKMAGITRDTWARLERGDAGVSLGTMARAMGALGLLSLVAQLAEPGRDRVGQQILRERLPTRIRKRRGER